MNGTFTLQIFGLAFKAQFTTDKLRYTVQALTYQRRFSNISLSSNHIRHYYSTTRSLLYEHRSPRHISKFLIICAANPTFQGHDQCASQLSAPVKEDLYHRRRHKWSSRCRNPHSSRFRDHNPGSTNAHRRTHPPKHSFRPAHRPRRKLDPWHKRQSDRTSRREGEIHHRCLRCCSLNL